MTPEQRKHYELRGVAMNIAASLRAFNIEVPSGYEFTMAKNAIAVLALSDEALADGVEKD